MRGRFSVEPDRLYSTRASVAGNGVHVCCQKLVKPVIGRGGVEYTSQWDKVYLMQVPGQCTQSDITWREMPAHLA